MVVLSGRCCARRANLESVTARNESLRKEARDCSHIPAYTTAEHHTARPATLPKQAVRRKGIDRSQAMLTATLRCRRDEDLSPLQTDPVVDVMTPNWVTLLEVLIAVGGHIDVQRSIGVMLIG